MHPLFDEAIRAVLTADPNGYILVTTRKENLLWLGRLRKRWVGEDGDGGTLGAELASRVVLVQEMSQVLCA
jgi:hypothetical protein